MKDNKWHGEQEAERWCKWQFLWKLTLAQHFSLSLSPSLPLPRLCWLQGAARAEAKKENLHETNFSRPHSNICMQSHISFFPPPLFFSLVSRWKRWLELAKWTHGLNWDEDADGRFSWDLRSGEREKESERGREENKRDTVDHYTSGSHLIDTHYMRKSSFKIHLCLISLLLSPSPSPSFCASLHH